MFESVRTLQELNKARAQAVLAGEDSSVINSAYNLKRKEIMAGPIPYNPVKIYRPQYEDKPPILFLPYKGGTDRQNTIVINQNGFYF